MAHPPENITKKNWLKYFQYQEDRDSPSDARNILLVVTALITAVTFQAGVSPPGGVWQDGKVMGHMAGQAIYAAQKQAFYVFLISNTIALSSSILILVFLTNGFPFHFEILVATGSMIVTYGSAVFAVTPKESVRYRYVLAAAAVPFAFRFLIEMFKEIEKNDKLKKSWKPFHAWCRKDGAN